MRMAAGVQFEGDKEQAPMRQTAEDELEYEMFAPAILPGAERIIAEGGVPAHISTAVMFAGLKKLFGLKADMMGAPEFTADGRAIERWKLYKNPLADRR